MILAGGPSGTRSGRKDSAVRLPGGKTPITPITKRLAWALEHVNWTQSQWNSVPWSDETWVTSDRHTRTWVTWRPREEYYTTYIVERIQRKRGWIVSGTFHGSRKGPCLFWEKDWGKISQIRTVNMWFQWFVRILPLKMGCYLCRMVPQVIGHSRHSINWPNMVFL